jgi:hypothetical protein
MWRMPALAPEAGAGRRAQLGQGIVEYGLILSLSALLAAVILVFMGGTLAEVLDYLARTIDEAT